MKVFADLTANYQLRTAILLLFDVSIRLCNAFKDICGHILPSSLYAVLNLSSKPHCAVVE